MSQNDIAVVGMAGRFPGAGDVRQFWRNLRNGVESVKTYSLDELREVGAPLQLIEEKGYVPASAPLEGIDLFDAGLFGISPSDAKVMNPQLRVLLECAWEALEDACIDPIREGPTTGVFVGGSSNDYILPLILSDIPTLHSQNSLRWGIWNDSSFLATRLSYHLNLSGPSLTIQTACSTALVCVHQACSALLSGDCNVALAGAVSITLLEKRGYLFRREGIMSQDGHCRPFDENASGTIEGDGVGLVVLKRLDDAVARNHNVRAIIKGSRINNDGNLKLGFSAPSAKAQAAVVRGAIRDAGVLPSDISYIEAHGTGTVLGDAIELDALNDVFKVDQPKQKRWFLGSVKGNIGHLDAAAGIAGLVKGISILEQRHIPPTLIVKQQDEKDHSRESRFVCNRNGVELSEKNGPLFIGVSSFGIGGTNVHLVLSGALPRSATRSTSQPEVVVLSAKSEAALQCSVRNLALHLREHDDVCLADVALSLRTGRRHLPYRYAVVAENRTEAIELLEKFDLPQRDGEGGPLTLYFPHYKIASLRPFQNLFEEDQVFRDLVSRRLQDASMRAGIVDLTRVFRAGDWGDHLWGEWRKFGEIEMLVSTVIQLCLAETWLSFGVESARLLAEGGGLIAAGALGSLSFLKGPLRNGGASEEAIYPSCSVEVSASELTAALDSGERKRVFEQLEVRDKGDVLQISGPPAVVEQCLSRLDALKVSYAPRLGIPSGEEDRRLLGSAMDAWLTGETASERAKLGAVQAISEHGSRVLSAAEFAGISGTMLVIGGVAEESLRSFTRAHPDLEVFGHDESSPTKYKTALAKSWARLWMRRKLPDSAAIWAPSVHGRLISLPSYPFDRKSFWLAERSVPFSVRLPGASDDADAEGLCYSIGWEESPLSAYRNGSKGAIAVVPHPSSPGLASAIARVDPQVKVIGADAGSDDCGEGSKESTLHSMFQDLRDRSPRPPIILYGRMFFHPPENTSTRVRLEGFLAGEFAHLLCTLKALATAAKEAEAHLIVVCNGLVKILHDDILLPERALLLGLVQAARREFPAIKARLVDVKFNEEGAISDEMVECLVKEARSNDDALIVGYRGEKRYSRRFKKSDFAQSGSSIALRDGASYLITGGLGGVGSQLASCLVARTNVRLVLLTRDTKQAWRDSAQTENGLDSSPGSAVEAERRARKQQRVAELESRGASVKVVECDIGDSVAVRDCLQRVTAEYGPIRGVIHAAGIPEASLIRSMTPENIRAQLSAKVFGTVALLEHLNLESLDFIVFCSAGERPNALAQTCYVGANRFMDATAACLQTAGYQAVSIGWERWHGTGMAEAVERTHKKVTGKELGRGITPEQGKAIFRRIMRSIPTPYVLVSDEPPDLRGAEEQARSEDKQRTRDVPPDVVTMEQIVEDLSNLWSRVLGVESLDPQANILELGGHSLITTQVVNAMHSKHPKANLKLRDVYDNPTVASLADVIWQRCLASPGEMKNGMVENLDGSRSKFFDVLRRAAAAESSEPAVIDSETIWTIKKELNFIAYPHELSRFDSIAQAGEYLEEEWRLQNSLQATPEWASPGVLDAMVAHRRLISTDSDSTTLKEAIFLISAPRSGSTLLKSILGAHPAIVCPPELSLLLHDTLDTLVESLTGSLARQSLVRTVSELLHTESETGARLIDALVARKTSIAEVYRILQALANPAVILDKCPNYSLDPSVIARAEALFANPRYIILTRHPAAVVESFVRNRMHRLYTLDKVHPVWFAKEIYRRSLQTITSLQHTIDVSRVHVVRFEDLVRDPDGTTSEIFKFLNVAPLREPLRAMPPDRFSGSVSDPDFLRHDSIESAKSNEWRRLSLPFALDEEISNMASSLGYEI